VRRQKKKAVVQQTYFYAPILSMAALRNQGRRFFFAKNQKLDDPYVISRSGI